MLDQQAVGIAHIAKETGLARQTVYRIKDDPAGADQRNGVILGHVLGARNGDTAAVSRGAAAGFTATFEIVAADKAGVVG
jgi:hypothetical protein